MSQKKVAVIGGGASGLIASYYASEKCEVSLFEKEKRIGRKILISGNGRCNISNTHIEKNRYHGNNNSFVNNVFGQYDNSATAEFFRSIGLPFVEKQDGKLFPASLQSSTVVRIFEYELKKRGVKTHLEYRIKSIKSKGDKFLLNDSQGKELEFDSVILACGSSAYPSVGGSKLGYEIATSLGHKIFKPFPVILPLNIIQKLPHKLQGIKWDVALTVMSKEKTIQKSLGEMLFTGYGISGPVTLNISRAVNELIILKEDVKILVDFFPEYSFDELYMLLESIWQNKSKNLVFSLYGILKEKMPEVILEMSGINPEMRIFDVSEKLKLKIINALKKMTIMPGKSRGFDDAVAASGGVSVDEIDFHSMESKKVSGLYITGELLDIDGDSGGFNLQFAWSTGAIAGRIQNS